jgi:hypothetical protein
MAANSDLKQFAVFINSKNELTPSVSKSDVVIPFNGNLANHDPLRTYRVSIVDVLFSNIFYNVRPGVSAFQYVDTFAAGRNRAASYRVVEVEIPYGFYGYDTFTDWANSDRHMGDLQPLNAPTTVNVFYGFGSTYPDRPDVSTNNIAASAFSLILAKIWFQTPSLGDMYQNWPADNSVTPITSHSGIYSGKYLIDNTTTYGMLHQLGYSFTNIVTPDIPGTPFKGWGVPIYYRSGAGTTQYSFDNVNFGVSAADTTIKTIVPLAVSDFTGLDDLYIHCPQLRTQYQSGVSKAPLAPNDVVAVIPISVPFGQKMSFIPQFPLQAFLMNTNITQLQFVMTNSNNVPLDFHGIDWALTMYVEELPDESRAQLEDNPDGARPELLQMNRFLNAGAFMEGRLKRQKNSLNRFS